MRNALRSWLRWQPMRMRRDPESQAVGRPIEDLAPKGIEDAEADRMTDLGAAVDQMTEIE